MPTANRRPFVPLAIRHFLGQDYATRELVIVDDGADPVQDLVPDDPRIRYLRFTGRRSVGAKRNVACREARGEIIVHWDDDDWVAPWRLRYQVERLLASGASVAGLSRILYHQPATGRSWQYSYPEGKKRWFGGNTLCYRKAYWTRHPFEDVDVGEDARFVWSDPSAPMTALDDTAFVVGMIHATNVSPKRTGQPYWRPIATEVVRALMGDDFEVYRSLSDARPHVAEARA
jgi:glycosyltransferase involved in cell wall biosynthesis